MRALLLIGALALAKPPALPAQQAAQQVLRGQADSVFVLRRGVALDTSRVRELTTANEAEVLRVVNELRAREAGILQALRRVPLAHTAERRTLEEELAKLSREAFTVMSVIESRCVESRTAAPPGYLGLTITTDVVVRDSNVTIQRSFVSSVEPGSPAERAGVLSGDVLVSIAGLDAMDELPDLSRKLEPGRKVDVVVERRGRPMTLDVTVAQRPQRFDRSCPQFERAIQPLRMGGVARVWVQDSTDRNGNRVMYMVTTPGSPTPPAPPSTPATAPTSPAPPALVAFGTTTGGASSVSYFAGAQFRALDDDWRVVLGLRPATTGVLVNEVAPGSPAAQSGLRVGDVVTSIDGTAASSPFVVVRLLGLNEQSQASLRVIRAREPRVVQFRWGRR